MSLKRDAILTRLDRDGVLHVRLNRPEKGNAFDAAMARELRQIFHQASATPGVRLVLLSGEGRHFCTGADLGWMAHARRLSPDENQRDARALAGLYQAILGCAIPVVARVHGAVRGGGVGLTAAADISACLSGTTFSFPEAALGLVPGVLTPVVTRRIGVSKFLELALTGRKLAASEAQLAGLVHFAGSRRLLDRYVDRAIQGILSAPSQTIRRIKASVLAGSAIPRRRLVELASLTAAARTGEEARI